MEITGTKGTYIFAGGDYRIIQNIDGEKVVTTGKNPPSTYQRFYKNVANHLVKGTKLIITPEWSRRPIHIIDLANKSAKLGKALKTKYA